jgi:hypothetical protein
VSKRYLVTIIETFLVEADDRDDARQEALELHPSTLADTLDVQVEYVGEARDAA